MSQDVEDLKQAMAAIATENRAIHETHERIERRVAELQGLLRQMCDDFDEQAARLLSDSRNAVVNARQAVDRMTDGGTATELVAAQETHLQALSIFGAASNIRSSMLFYREAFNAALEQEASPGTPAGAPACR